MSKKTRASCKVCKKELPRLAVEHGDPFCSQICCRRDYGVQFHSDKPGDWGKDYEVPTKVAASKEERRARARRSRRLKRQDPEYRARENEALRKRRQKRRAA